MQHIKNQEYHSCFFQGRVRRRQPASSIQLGIKVSASAKGKGIDNQKPGLITGAAGEPAILPKVSSLLSPFWDSTVVTSRDPGPTGSASWA